MRFSIAIAATIVLAEAAYIASPIPSLNPTPDAFSIDHINLDNAIEHDAVIENDFKKNIAEDAAFFEEGKYIQPNNSKVQN
jgi:hypothetical protein